MKEEEAIKPHRIVSYKTWRNNCLQFVGSASTAGDKPCILVCRIVCMVSSHTILKHQEEDEVEEGVPVCGANYSSPVVDQASFIDEIHYSIGGKKYIENAPHVEARLEGNIFCKSRGRSLRSETRNWRT
ncbi:MAG TPA: hypothetical protein VFT58_02940 [Nitrososphaera sp.]|nr:hypothetical protein [Nitrososphaera sp.]